MKWSEYGRACSIIGEVVDKHRGMAIMNTFIGGRIVIGMRSGELLLLVF